MLARLARAFCCLVSRPNDVPELRSVSLYSLRPAISRADHTKNGLLHTMNTREKDELLDQAGDLHAYICAAIQDENQAAPVLRELERMAARHYVDLARLTLE